MIIVFGSISVDLHFDVERLPETNETIAATHYSIIHGGKAANQALAATRAGAKVSLVGNVGDDEFGTQTLDNLRNEGVTTSGVAQTATPTGTTALIKDSRGLSQAIITPGANSDSSSDQVPVEILDKKVLVLVQTELAPEENSKLLAKAKEAGAQTMMNLAPSIDLTQKDLDNLDYLIVNQDEARPLAKKLGLKVEDDALKMAQGLAKQGQLNCIVTVGAQGAVTVTQEGVAWSVQSLDVKKVIDRFGAGDAYCGTLAACVHAGLPLPRAMKRASIAASLTCTKKSAQNAFPSLDDIDNHMNDLDDPQQHDL